MKNITITLDEETAAWLKREAARAGCSVSRTVGELLRQRSRELAEYDVAMRDYLRLKPVALGDGTRYPTRKTLYERPRLRRQ
ncbi:MAG: hypothetical protein ACHQAR_00365 [Steroidobacterales bacterium]